MNQIMDQIIVPIIGRPNVGKSTLFNRLVGEDRAITGSEAGVTRDRISEDLHWDDQNLTLIDTAGYRSETQAPDNEFILRQVDSMIETGDCLIFVVDASDGITALDRKIAEKLYENSERTILAVNKIDPGRNEQQYLTPFYELGFQEIIAVSAIHGDGIRKLRQRILKLLPDRSVSIPDSGIKLSIVGRPNVGKSTLLNTVLGYERVMVSEEPGTTRDIVEVSFDVGGRRFHMMDTGGLRRQANVDEDIEKQISSESLRGINFSDVVFLMLDWNQRVTKQDQRIAGLINDRYRGCIILVNKADEPDEDNENNWLQHIRDRLYFMDYAPILFTSGRERRGLESLFTLGREIFNEMHTTFTEEEVTNALLDLKSEISWPSQQAREIILVSLQQVGVNPITFELEARNPNLMTDSDLRHLNRLLRKKLNIGISPVKLAILNEDDAKNDD